MTSKRPNAWLNAHARDVSSQFGEDGILEQVLQMLPETDRWCVEFGAHDGQTYSNTAHLINASDFNAVLIEPNSRRFDQLRERYASNPRVFAVKGFVGFNPEDGLDAILSPLAVPRDFDVLSIDIDGNDFHAWSAIKAYRPKIVLIEFNPTIPNEVEFVQTRDPRANHGSSIAAICRLGKEKGYELVAATFSNAIFVESRYFPLFGIEDNSVRALRSDFSAVSQIFQGYDGTVFLTGSRQLFWHRIPLSDRNVQQLPLFLRQFPDNYGPIRRLVFKCYRTWRILRLRMFPG